MLGQWEYCVWHHHGGHMSSHICPNPWKAHRVDPHINCGLGVIVKSRGRFMDCNRCPTLVGMLITEEAEHTGGQVLHRKSCEIAVKPKTLQKSYLKKLIWGFLYSLKTWIYCNKNHYNCSPLSTQISKRMWRFAIFKDTLDPVKNIFSAIFWTKKFERT